MTSLPNYKKHLAVLLFQCLWCHCIKCKFPFRWNFSKAALMAKSGTRICCWKKRITADLQLWQKPQIHEQDHIKNVWFTWRLLHKHIGSMH